MKKLAILVLSALLFLTGCSTGYTAEDLEQAREEAYEEGYDNGYSEGRSEARSDCGSTVYHEILDAGFGEAEDAVSSLESIADAPDDHTMEDIWEHTDSLREFLGELSKLLDSYKSGIEP